MCVELRKHVVFELDNSDSNNILGRETDQLVSYFFISGNGKFFPRPWGRKVLFKLAVSVYFSNRYHASMISLAIVEI